MDSFRLAARRLTPKPFERRPSCWQLRQWQRQKPDRLHHSRRADHGMPFNADNVPVLGQYRSHTGGDAPRVKFNAHRRCDLQMVQTRCKSRNAAGSTRAASLGSRPRSAIRRSRRSAALGPFLVTARSSEADMRMSLAMRSISASSQHPKSDSEAALNRARNHASINLSVDWLCLPWVRANI